MATKWDYNKVKEFVESDGKTELISDSYVQCDKNLTFKCQCGELFHTSFTKFKKKKSPQKTCKKCSKERRSNKMKLSFEDVKPEIESYGLILLSNEYEKIDKPLRLRCKCGEVFDCSLNVIRSYKKYQCNKCSGKHRANLEEVKILTNQIANGFKILSTEYKGVMYKLDFKCPLGHFFRKNWNHFYNEGERCPICISSKGEVEVEKYLRENNFCYIPQYSFKDCVRKQLLAFDFAVFLKGNLICLIEYDGRHHFQPVNFGGITDKVAKDKFEVQLEIDSIKNKYCKDNNINLIRIPYWYIHKIPKKLDEELRKYIAWKEVS